MVWYGTVRYGMVWYGMVWYGMVWYVPRYPGGWGDRLWWGVGWGAPPSYRGAASHHLVEATETPLNPSMKKAAINIVIFDGNNTTQLSMV